MLVLAVLDEHGRWAKRAQIYCSTVLLQGGVVPDKFRKRSIDCCIRLDPTGLFVAGYQIFVSDAGVALIGRDVPDAFIQNITLIRHPRFTLYSKPTAAALAALPEGEDEVTCGECGDQFRPGTWYCLNCWVPLTISGIADRQAFLADATERKRELQDHYGLTPAQFEALRQLPASSVMSLYLADIEVWRHAHEGPEPEFSKPGHTAKRPRTVPPQEGQSGVASSSSAVPVSPALAGPAGQASSGAATRTNLPGAISDKRIRKLIEGAKREGYLSHTDRHHKDATYRANCATHNPPTPEFLTFTSGEVAREDGSECHRGPPKPKPKR